jgi:hypothetical protein
MVTNLTFSYSIDQTKYSEMNNIFRIIRSALCHKTVYHIIRFLVYRSPGMSMCLKRFCSNLFSCICHKNYSNFPCSLLRICFMLTILKDLVLLNAIGLQLCTVLIPAHQKARRSHETMTSRSYRPSKTGGS